MSLAFTRILQGGLAVTLAVVSAAGVASAHPGLHHDIERVTLSLLEWGPCTDLLVERAYYFRLDGQPDCALKDLNQAANSAPDDPDVARERGLALVEMGRDVEAVVELSRSLELGGSHPGACAARARIWWSWGEVDKALQDNAAALAMKPDVELFAEQGRLLETVKRWDEAASLYSAGLAETGGAVILRKGLIRVETARGRYDAALALIEQELAAASVDTEWYLRKAEVLDTAGRYAEAQAARRQALAEADRVIQRRATALNLYSRAQVHLALGERDAAVFDLQKALEKAPRFQEAARLLKQAGVK